jgi:glycosyltransferase involved in cell wall biosynthesis
MDVDIFELGPREAEMDILIPSCKAIKQLRGIYAEIQRNTTGNFRLIIAANPGISAARNRNACLNHSHAQYILMMDDDITGLYPSWNRHLIRELKSDPSISIVSARLMHKNGSPAPMMSSKYILDGDFEEVKKIPTACTGFRQTLVRFDENFKGSGFEDDAFCLAMGPRIIIDNRVKVIHLNEMKYQQENWEHNKKYFEETYASRSL